MTQRSLVMPAKTMDFRPVLLTASTNVGLPKVDPLLLSREHERRPQFLWITLPISCSGDA